MRSLRHHATFNWGYMENWDEFKDNLLKAFFTIIGVVFFLNMVFTHNLLTAIFVSGTIALSYLSIAVVLFIFMDLHLSIEHQGTWFIACMVLAALATDYGYQFSQSQSVKRERKVLEFLGENLPYLLGGLVNTLCNLLMLLGGSKLTQYYALVLSGSLLLSFLASNLFLAMILFAIGPSGGQCYLFYGCRPKSSRRDDSSFDDVGAIA